VRDKTDRRAQATRTLVYIDSNELKVFSYACPGMILLEPRGESSRGFDTLFCVDATAKTLAEMNEKEKVDAFGDAWKQLGDWLQIKNKE